MIEDFLAEMRAEGLLDSAGQFTLNAARAREKLQQYQFKNPHEYVLAIYRCAVLSGATRFDCQIDADDCFLEFDGEPLSHDDFRILWGTLFMRQDNRNLARLRYLALGLNAALGFGPGYVTLESYGWQVTFKGREEKAGPAQGGDRTRIHVRLQAGWKVAQRFVQKLRDLPPEGAALRAATTWGPVPVRINGRSYAEPLAPPRCLARAAVIPLDASCRVPEPPEVDAPCVSLVGDYGAVLYLVPPHPDDTVEFVVAGVKTGRQLVLEGLTGVVSTTNLLLDASQSEIVTDERFASLCNQLDEVCQAMVARLAACYPDELPEEVSHQARAFLWQAARSLYQQYPEPAAAGPHRASLADVPLVPMVDGSHRSFAQVRALGPTVRYTSRQWPELSPETLQDILLWDGSPLFKGVELSCVDSELERLRSGQARRRAYEERPEEPPSIQGDMEVRVPVHGPGVEGEAALGLDLQRDSCWRLFKKGRLLNVIPLGPGWPSGFQAATSHAGLELDAAFDLPLKNEAYQAARQALLEAVPRLFAALPQDSPPARAWELVDFLGQDPDSSQWPPEGTAGALPAVPTTEEPISFAELERVRRRWSKLYYLLDGRPSVPQVTGLGPLPFPVLCLNKSQVARLVKVLPRDTLQLAREHPEVLRRLNYESFLRRPVGTALSGPFLVERPAAGGRMCIPQASTTQGLELWLTFEGRQVCRVVQEWPFGPIAAELPIPPQVGIQGDWKGVLPGDEWDDWLEDLLEESRQLGAELAGRLPQLDSREQARARHFLTRQLAFECQRCQQRMEDPASDPLVSQLWQAEVFVDLTPRCYSAAQLLQAGPRVGYVEKPRPLPPGLREIVLLLTPDELASAHHIFGLSRLVNRTRHLASLNVTEQPQVPLPERDYVLRLEVPGARVGVLRDPRRPGEVLLCCAGQVVETVHSSGDVPHCGVIDHPELKADPDWTRIVRDATFQQVVRDLQLALLRTIEDWLGERRELGYLIELLRSLSQYNPLREQWGSRPLLEGWRDPLTLLDLERRLRVAGPPEYLAAELAAEFKQELPPEEWSQLTRGLKHTNPILAPSGWHSKVLGRDVGQDMLNTARELRFERRAKLELNLDEHWPGTSWLARRPLGSVDSLKGGELGLRRDWEGEDVFLLAYKGVQVAQLELKLGLALHACVNGHFPPSEGRPGELRDDKAARQLLLPAVVDFLRELARDAEVEEELRSVVLLRAWTRLPGTWARSLDSVRCLPLEGGRRGDLGRLEGQERVLYHDGEPGQVPSDGRPRRGDELALELRSGSPLLAELRRVLGRRMVRLVPATLLASNPETPTPAPAPAPEPVAEAWVAEGPEEQLLGRVRSEFRLLGEGRTFTLPEGYLNGLRLVAEVSARLCWLDDRGLALNSRHPAVVRALFPGSPPRHLYLLLSSLFSAINRADENITDVHEREFHNAILATLVGE